MYTPSIVGLESLKAFFVHGKVGPCPLMLLCAAGVPMSSSKYTEARAFSVLTVEEKNSSGHRSNSIEIKESVSSFVSPCVLSYEVTTSDFLVQTGMLTNLGAGEHQFQALSTVL